MYETFLLFMNYCCMKRRQTQKEKNRQPKTPKNIQKYPKTPKNTLQTPKTLKERYELSDNVTS